MAEPYRPVACAFHEGLEFAVLRRQRLRLHYLGDTGEVEVVALPIDVATRSGAEWLTCRLDDGQTLVLRLDRIKNGHPV
ncbi:MAG: transcriptional antiterminator, Rof [Betaproteobacteria bacterium]|nr:transcriptional antiterminator, Rof [Betaproteobacteria bacterium]